jgi:hypothetical protein
MEYYEPKVRSTQRDDMESRFLGEKTFAAGGHKMLAPDRDPPFDNIQVNESPSCRTSCKKLI